MRNFEQRLGEIQRRGNELKRKRSIRNKILAACIPMVLCVGLCAAFLPDLKAAPAAGENTGPAGVVVESYSETQTAPSVSLLVQQIRVEGQYWKATHTEPEKTTKITDLIRDLTGRKQNLPGETVITNPAHASDDSDYGKIENRGEMGYVISVVTSEGTKQYYLLGSMLKDVQADVYYNLEEKDLFALNDALGIPFY